MLLSPIRLPAIAELSAKFSNHSPRACLPDRPEHSAATPSSSKASRRPISDSSGRFLGRWSRHLFEHRNRAGRQGGRAQVRRPSPHAAARLRLQTRQRWPRHPFLQAYLGHKNIQHTVRYSEMSPTSFKTSGGSDRKESPGSGVVVAMPPGQCHGEWDSPWRRHADTSAGLPQPYRETNVRNVHSTNVARDQFDGFWRQTKDRS